MLSIKMMNRTRMLARNKCEVMTIPEIGDEKAAERVARKATEAGLNIEYMTVKRYRDLVRQVQQELMAEAVENAERRLGIA